MKPSQRLQRRQAPAIQPPSPTSAGATSVDIWLQRIAHLTQVGLLGLGVFGYFYTVLPVFQNQQLQEQAAKLELEKATAQQRLDELLAEQLKVQAEIVALRDNWQKERDKNAQLASNAEDSRKQELLAKQRAIKAEGALAVQVKKLESSRWELVVFDLLTEHVISSLNVWLETLNKSNEPRAGAFFREQESHWPHPYAELLDAVEAVREKRTASDQIPSTYYSELRAFVEARKASLQCTLPDFAALEASYQLQLAAIEPEIETETNASIDQLVKEYTDRGERVKITDDYRQSVRKSVRSGKVLELNSTFDKQLSEMWQLCKDKAISVIEELRKSKEVTS